MTTVKQIQSGLRKIVRKVHRAIAQISVVLRLVSANQKLRVTILSAKCRRRLRALRSARVSRAKQMITVKVTQFGLRKTVKKIHRASAQTIAVLPLVSVNQNKRAIIQSARCHQRPRI